MKRQKNQADSKGRKIHITLPENVHQRLRVKCAIEDLKIQDYVAGLITEAVSEVAVMDNGKAVMKEA